MEISGRITPVGLSRLNNVVQWIADHRSRGECQTKKALAVEDDNVYDNHLAP
jgi:hypothetical protein